LVLVDGDGYIFKNAFLASGDGARAAAELYTQVLNYVKENNIVDSPSIEVVVNVYAHKDGLARALYDADMLRTPSNLDEFFVSFTQSQSLFHFIDCGPGKERVDAKLRGKLYCNSVELG